MEASTPGMANGACIETVIIPERKSARSGNGGNCVMVGLSELKAA